MKRLVMVAMGLCAANAVAMPTQAELKTAQPLVAELMAEDIAAFKAKGMTAEAVGDTSVKYAQEAETEAAKFLLLKGAVSYYVRGEAYDKAADAVATLRTEIQDVPPTVMGEILRKNTARLTAKKAPRLFEQYRLVQIQVSAAKEAVAVKAELAKRPGDVVLMRKLAEAQALSGDWNAALATFAQLGNDAGKIAKFETEGKNLPEVADFWWTYESYLKGNDADLFKQHAAVIYRQCMDDGLLDGLRKSIVEKRMKQMPEVAMPVAVPSPKLARIRLPVEGTDPIVLIPCPAGSFTLGFDNRHVAFAQRKVTLSRPFWMSEAPITVGQYTALMGSFDVLFEPRFGVKPRDGMRRLYKVMGEKSCAISGVDVEEIDRYCAKLSTKYKRLLPHDCIVRLPTEAEWMYAFKCGGSVKEPNYAALAQGKEAVNYRAIGVDVRETLTKVIHDAGVSFSNDKHVGYYVPCYRVKTCKPNDWGFYDMPGLCWERLADRASAAHAGSATWNKKGVACFTELNRAFAAVGEVDPVLITDDKPGQTLSIMCHQKNWGLWVVESQRCWDVGFRIVIGPDLVSEWKSKCAKK